MLLQGLELDYDAQLHLPVVSAVSKMFVYHGSVICRMLTTTISIEIGDVLFCVNSSEKQSESPSRSLHFSYGEDCTFV